MLRWLIYWRFTRRVLTNRSRVWQDPQMIPRPLPYSGREPPFDKTLREISRSCISWYTSGTKSPGMNLWAWHAKSWVSKPKQNLDKIWWGSSLISHRKLRSSNLVMYLGEACSPNKDGSTCLEDCPYMTGEGTSLVSLSFRSKFL